MRAKNCLETRATFSKRSLVDKRDKIFDKISGGNRLMLSRGEEHGLLFFARGPLLSSEILLAFFEVKIVSESWFAISRNL